MNTSPDKLPQWKGRPVPWVTAWTGQISKVKPQIVRYRGKPAYTYRDPGEFRDEHGVLWQREGAGRAGDPMFKVVSTYRQRMSMRRRVCQVCGDKIADKVEGESTPWLVDQLEWESFLEAQERHAPVLTVTTPVCPDCIDLATDLCPHLRKYEWHLLRVDLYSLWGVHGRTLINNRVEFDAVSYEDTWRIPTTLAHQQMIRFDSYDEIGAWT